MFLKKKDSFLNNNISKKSDFIYIFFKKKKNIFFKKYFKNFGISYFLNLKKNILIFLKHFYILNLYQILLQNNKKLKKKNIFLHKKNKSYKGIRLLKNLPINGQRTKTNSKTRKKHHII